MENHFVHSKHMESSDNNLRTHHTLACIWDFDKTLTPGYMQTPLFQEYGIDEAAFWREVNKLPEIYGRQGIHVSKDTVYLNHLLSYVKNGPLRGLTNQKLRELGARIELCPGVPEVFNKLREYAKMLGAERNLDIDLEHYIISTGIAEMIRGSALAAHVDGIYGCEFIEQPLPPHYSDQQALQLLEESTEISQIGVMVDNTIKTRFIFEINKGSNKNPEIDVNAVVRAQDRRVPFENMVYIADGPSDVPVFSVVRKGGGFAYAVYSQNSRAERRQNDSLQESKRVNGYGPNDYRATEFTFDWLCMRIEDMVNRIAKEREYAVQSQVSQPPRHLHAGAPANIFSKPQTEPDVPASLQQPSLL